MVGHSSPVDCIRMAMKTHTLTYDDELDQNALYQWVTFRMAGEIYAIDVMQVQEVLRFTEVAPVPGAPDFVLGIINLRGSVVTIIDTRKKFGLPARPITDETRIIIVESNGQTVGLVVDGMAEVFYTRGHEIAQPPHGNETTRSNYIRGVCQVNEKLLILIGIDKIISTQ